MYIQNTWIDAGCSRECVGPLSVCTCWHWACTNDGKYKSWNHEGSPTVWNWWVLFAYSFMQQCHLICMWIMNKIHHDLQWVIVLLSSLLLSSVDCECTLTAEHVMIVGRDSLRCLALATVDEPRKKEDMNLTDPTQFIHFEVHCLCFTLQNINRILHYADDWQKICCSLSWVIVKHSDVIIIMCQIIRPNVGGTIDCAHRELKTSDLHVTIVIK